MAYTITPVLKSGNVTTDCSDSSSPYTITTNASSDPSGVGFRNVAVGALLTTHTSTLYLVTVKNSDSSIDCTYVSGTAHSQPWTASAFTYTNPILSDSTGTTPALRSGCAAITMLEMNKKSSPFKMGIPTLDSDSTIAMDTEGVDRTFSISIDFSPQTSTIRYSANGGTNYVDVSTLNINIDNFITICESMADGQQFTASTIPTVTTDRPTRTYRVFVDNVRWKYVGGEPGHIELDLDFSERGL